MYEFESKVFYRLFALMCDYLIRTNLRVILRVFIFAHHELSIISRALIFAQGHFTRNFFSIIYLKQVKIEPKFKEYGIWKNKYFLRDK